ncbi:MAG: hypothetical protein Tsb0014_27270 [Pleurocapsa sp.]
MIVLLSLTFVGIIFVSKIATEKKSLFYSTAILLGVAIVSYSTNFPALAATDSVQPGAIKNFVSEEEQTLQENLNLTPNGGHYSGLEYADETQGVEQVFSDESIEQTIEKYSSDNLTVAVANGSVRLSGRVKDKDVARHIIDKTKDIPGVREVTFNLGLDNQAL